MTAWDPTLQAELQILNALWAGRFQQTAVYII